MDNQINDPKKIDKTTTEASHTKQPTASDKPNNTLSLKELKTQLKDFNKNFKRAKKHLRKDLHDSIAKALKILDAAIQNQDLDAAREAYTEASLLSKKHLKHFKKSPTREIIESMLYALLFAMILRTFFIEPFKIPTRSMVPTLLDGDQLFVTKLSYGIRLPILNDYILRFADPQRGDVVVFAFPRQEAAEHLARTQSRCMQASDLAEDKDYIKRIIGIEGDVIEVIDQVVHVNGEPIAPIPLYQRKVYDVFLSVQRNESWNLERHGESSYTTITHELAMSHFGPIRVAPQHVFVMGDNRDNSADSRCWGQVPLKNIKGRAQIIWWSLGSQGPRWQRLFSSIH